MISIRKGCRYGRYNVYGFGEMFEDRVIIRLEDDKIIVEKPTPLYDGKTLKPVKKGGNGRMIEVGFDLDNYIGMDIECEEEESNNEIKIYYLV